MQKKKQRSDWHRWNKSWKTEHHFIWKISQRSTRTARLKSMHAHNAGTWIQLLLLAHVSTVDRSLSTHNTARLGLLTCSVRTLLCWTATSDSEDWTITLRSEHCSKINKDNNTEVSNRSGIFLDCRSDMWRGLAHGVSSAKTLINSVSLTNQRKHFLMSSSLGARRQWRGKRSRHARCGGLWSIPRINKLDLELIRFWTVITCRYPTSHNANLIHKARIRGHCWVIHHLASPLIEWSPRWHQRLTSC